MKLTYDKVSGDITSVFFGMYEVTYKVLDNDYAFLPSVMETVTIDGSLLPELGITGPITVLACTTGAQINIGVQSFSFESSGVDKWTFNYLTDLMTGGVDNLDTYMYLGKQSQTNAFHLSKLSQQ
ncbi:MAG: hypothetical protein ABIG43_03390 [Chloroflexota bacterium]